MPEQNVDFAMLQSTLESCARSAFHRVRSAHPDRTFFGFALYSDDAAMTIGHLVGTTDLLREPVDDDLRWNPLEWDLQDGLELFDPVRDILRRYRNTEPEGKLGESFEPDFFSMCASVLETLRAEGLFSALAGTDEAYVTFTVADWSERDIFEWVEQLNPPSVVAGYRAWMELAAAVPAGPSRTVIELNDADRRLSDSDRDFLCLASRGRLAELTTSWEAGAPDRLVVDEALVLAARTGKRDVCEFLLQRGANTNHAGYMGKTAFEMATQENRGRVVEILEQHDSPPRESMPPEERHQLNQEILHLIQVVIPQQRAQRNG
jgi:hypothetical protein